MAPRFEPTVPARYERRERSLGIRRPYDDHRDLESDRRRGADWDRFEDIHLDEENSNPFCPTDKPKPINDRRVPGEHRRLFPAADDLNRHRRHIPPESDYDKFSDDNQLDDWKAKKDDNLKFARDSAKSDFDNRRSNRRESPDHRRSGDSFDRNRRSPERNRRSPERNRRSPERNQWSRDRNREDRSRDDKARDDRAREDRTKDDRARDDKSRDNRSRDDKSRDEKPKEDRTRDNRPRDDKSRDDRSRDDRPTEDRARDDFERNRKLSDRDDRPRDSFDRNPRPVDKNELQGKNVSENANDLVKPAAISFEPPPQPAKPKAITSIEDILDAPGRETRPARIVIILRGPPGSGKTYLARLIKDKEVHKHVLLQKEVLYNIILG